MTTKKKTTQPTRPENVYITVDCPRCDIPTRFHMLRPITRKVCPHCARVSYQFELLGTSDAVYITCMFVQSPNEYAEELDIDPQKVELDYTDKE